MRTFSLLTVAGLCVATTMAMVSVTDAQTDKPSANRRQQPAYSGTQIACTRVGCHPIPRGCRIEKEFTWDGMPTGFDLVVCPFR